MFADLVSDRSLQLHAMILVEVAAPLETMYVNDLKKQQADQLGYAVERAQAGLGSWWGSCAQILQKIHSNTLLHRLGITPRLTAEPVAFDMEWVQQEQITLELVFNFATILASNLAWSQVMFKYSLPHGIASLASRSRAIRENAMQLLREMVEAVLAALQPRHSGNTGLQEVLKAVAWQRQAFVAEIITTLRQTNFDPHHETIRRIAIELYSATASTKENLESTFGFLRDVVSRSTKNQKASQQLVWMYAQSSKYPATGGVPHIEVTYRDWARFKPGTNEALKQEFMRCMNPKNTPMPARHPADDDISLPRNAQEVQKKKWRNAGPLSHQKGVAGMAYLMHDQASGFSRASFCWRGLIVTEGEVRTVTVRPKPPPRAPNLHPELAREEFSSARAACSTTPAQIVTGCQWDFETMRLWLAAWLLTTRMTRPCATMCTSAAR